MQEQYRQSSLALLRAKKRTKSSDDPSFLEGSRRLVEFMYTCWQEQKCCDVLITSKGGNMHAHSVALGAYSTTLTETFYGFSNGDVIKLDLSDFRSDVVLNILHFLYTTELELNCHVIGQVLSCATELGLDIVVEMCMAYLEKVDVENAVLHYSIAENNALKELRDLVLDFLLTNFSKVSKTKHFVYMPYERLLAILKDDQLCVDEEIDMFHAVVHWVDFNRPTRIHHAYALLQCVRFVLMSAEVITSEVEPVDWIFEDRQSWREFLYEAMKFNALECVGSDLARKIKKEKRKCNQENGNESPTRRDREENGPIDEVSPRTSKTSKTQNGSPRASRTSNAESASTSKSKSRNTGSELIRKSLLNQQSSSPKQSEGQTSAGRNVSGSREEKKSSSAAERNSSQNRKSFEQDKRNTKSGNKRPQGKISSHVNNNSRNASRKNRHLRDKPPDSDVSNESLPVVKLGTNIRKKTNKDDPKKNIWMYEHAADGSLNQPNRGQPRSQSNYHHTAPSNNSNYRQTTQPNNSNYRRTTQQNKSNYHQSTQPNNSNYRETTQPNNSNYHQITQPNNANLHQIKQPNNNSNFHQTDHLNYNPTAQLSNATKPVVWRQSQPPPKLIQPQTTGVTYHTQLSREVRSLSVNNSNITCQPMDDQQQPSNNIIIPRMATRRKINRDEKLEMLCVISIGGIDLESLDPDRPGRLVCNYSVDDNQWNVINNPMSTYLHHHGVAVVEDKLYVVGGAIYCGNQNLGVATNDVIVFDAVTNQWNQSPPMIERRAYLAVAVWRNRIFAVCGENHERRTLDSIECFDVSTNQWNVITHIPGGAKVGVAAAVFQDGLFVVGGYNRDRQTSSILDDVVFFDLINICWILLNRLSVPRCHASLVVVDDRLVLIGGRTKLYYGEENIASLNTVEEYDIDCDTWTLKTSMLQGRHDMGCSALGSRLYIVGGMTSPNTSCLSSVECYDVRAEFWIDNIADFPHPVAGIACAALLYNKIDGRLL